MAESQNIEYKESWRDEYLKWVCGLANAQEKIKDNCKEAGNPMSEYTVKREDIMVMFKSLVSGTDQAANQDGG